MCFSSIAQLHVQRLAASWEMLVLHWTKVAVIVHAGYAGYHAGYMQGIMARFCEIIENK